MINSYVLNGESCGSVLELIKVNDVTYVYENRNLSGISDENNPVLRNITCEFESGRITAVTGSNGSGKTTLMRLITGVLKPQKGEIYIDNISIANMDIFDIGRLAGYVYQEPERQLFCATVREEIGYALRNEVIDKEESDRRIDEQLQRFGLEKLAERYPGQLSRGEKQRVMLAVVMAMRTRYLILDEPTSGLDMNARQRLGEMLMEIRSKGCGIVVVSHDRGFIEKYADSEIRLDMLNMREQYSDESKNYPVRCKSNGVFSLAGIDPRVKLFTTALLSTLAVLSGNELRLSAYLSALLVIMAAGGVSLREAVRRASGMFRLIICIFVLQCVFTRSGEVLVKICGFTVITSDGVHTALAVCIRLLILTCSALVLMSGESRDYIPAFTQLHIPYEIVFMLMITLRFLPILHEEIREVLTAVQMRGTRIKNAPIKDRADTYLRVMIPIISAAIKHTENINSAMISRAFRAMPDRTCMRRLRLNIRDIFAAIVSAAVFLLITILL